MVKRDSRTADGTDISVEQQRGRKAEREQYASRQERLKRHRKKAVCLLQEKEDARGGGKEEQHAEGKEDGAKAHPDAFVRA